MSKTPCNRIELGIVASVCQGVLTATKVRTLWQSRGIVEYLTTLIQRPRGELTALLTNLVHAQSSAFYRECGVHVAIFATTLRALGFAYLDRRRNTTIV